MQARAYKIPHSVLVLIHSPALEVLLIRRADSVSEDGIETDFWQSVTGSKDFAEEDLARTAWREVGEETGIDCAPGTPLGGALHDWGLENVYPIYPRWQHRYAPGVTHNRERVFSLCVPRDTPIYLNPREHTHWRWLPRLEAADLAYSPSNAEAILLLPQWATKP